MILVALLMTNKMFDTLKSIVQDVNDASGLEQALAIIVERTRQVMQVDAVSVYFHDIKTDQLVLMATDGLNQNAIGKIRLNKGQGLAGLVIDQLEPVNVKDAHTHPNYHFVTETDEITFHGFLGVPIIQHRNALGVLVVRQTRQRRFSANDETFLVTLAAQLAGAISYAEKMGELTRLLEGVDSKSFNMKGLSGSPGIAIGEAMVVFPAADLEAVPVYIGHLRKNDLDEASERQEQRHVEVEGDCGGRKPLQLEMVVGEQVIQLAAVFDGEDHRPFLVHLFQAVPHVFIQLGAPEKPVEQPAQQESWPVIKHIGIIDVFGRGFQRFNLRLVSDIHNGIEPSNQGFCEASVLIDS